jgi:hypothetical protein
VAVLVVWEARLLALALGVMVALVGVVVDMEQHRLGVQEILQSFLHLKVVMEVLGFAHL